MNGKKIKIFAELEMPPRMESLLPNCQKYIGKDI
jgi:hypothetical protein